MLHTGAIELPSVPILVLEMAKQFESFSPKEVCEYLQRHAPSLDNSVFDEITEHKIDGEVFLSLNDEYLREIAPILGYRLKIKRILNLLLTSCSNVSYSLCYSAVV